MAQSRSIGVEAQSRSIGVVAQSRSIGVVTLPTTNLLHSVLFRYGIIPKPGKMYAEDVMKPIYSNRAHDIIARFEQIQVISLVGDKNRRKSYSHKRQRERSESKTRPLTATHLLLNRFR